MSNYRAGDIIRMTREFVGMSREELSDEICSVQTLYRIESGKTRVKRELYARLMAKMERVPEKSYAICVGKNLELLEERKLFEQAMQNYDYEKADLYLGRMKEKADDNVITRQYLLKSEALMDYYCKRSDNQTIIEKLQEAVRLTLPDYEECLKKDFPFTEQEIMNLMSLANAYAHAGDVDEAVYIFERLLQCLQKDYIFGKYAEHMKLIILRNLSVAYIEKRQYHKAITLNEKCLNMAKENDEGKELHILLSDRACILKKQNECGQINRGELCMAEKYLKQAYLLACARRDNKMAGRLKEVYQHMFEKDLN